MTDAPTEGARSLAWRYGPLKSKIGILELADNRLAFAEGDDGENVVFDAPLEEVEVEGWPSYGVAPNSQVKLRVAGKKHRICFVMPSNSKQAAPPPGVGNAIPQIRRAERVAASVSTYEVGGQLGEQWRALLGG
jgi:hypothetical protein